MALPRTFIETPNVENIEKKRFKVLTTGDVVRTNRMILGQDANQLAYVYEMKHFGLETQWISLITERGVNLGGFSIVEQEASLVYVDSLDFIYYFDHVGLLSYHWEYGLFDPFKEYVKELKRYLNS